MQQLLNEELKLLRTLVEAYEQRDDSGMREKFYVFSVSGGAMIQHRTLNERVDETLIDELQLKGLLDIDYSGSGSTKIVVPTARARELIGQLETAFPEHIQADALADAVSDALASDDPLAWDHGLAVLKAVDATWRAGGYEPTGVPIAALVSELEDGQQAVAKALMRSLLAGDYIRESSDLGAADLPALATLTDRARGALGGWPSQDPQVLAQALVSALDRAAQHEADPVKKRRLMAVGETLRELGVATASEVVSKVLVSGG